MVRGWIQGSVAGLLLTAAGLSSAQQVPPMILDEKPKIEVRTGTKKKNQPEIERTEPEVDPKDVIIAIVDSRAMTKADLEERVSARYEQVLERLRSEVGGVVAQFGPDMEQRRQLLGEQELLQEQEEELARALRQEEADTVQEWVDFSLLAEEARRQRIVITDSEFRQRLEQIKRENQLEDDLVENALKDMKLSRADFEKYVYDALLIEKLVAQFNALNYSEEFLRERYTATPHLFYTPEKYRVAHFTAAIPVDKGRDKKVQAELRAVAQDVRARLRKGEDPEKLFLMDKFNDMPAGFFGDAEGWYTFRESILPPIVEYEARKMKVGDTSDILINRMRDENDDIVPVSFHVIKIMDKREEAGKTFESARPAIERSLVEAGRRALLEQLKKAGTHKVIYSLSGIRPDKIPTRDELISFEAKAQPINLKLPQS
jgi:hypothetical protein